MKIDRLIGIIATLQQKGKVTAPYLAEKFEVSRRTINRDIDAICAAGIPLVTMQGADGGISIMSGFEIDTTVFTEDELRSIFTGLSCLESVSYSKEFRNIAEKINGADIIADNIIINLASFYKESLAEKIEILRKAIKENRKIEFCYYYTKGEAVKTIEPYIIVFQWGEWYILGFSEECNDFRMYKLNRLWNIKITDKKYIKRVIPESILEFGKDFDDNFTVEAKYDSSVKYRIIETYGPDCFTETEDSRLYANISFGSAEKAMDWFLSLGSKAEIISPASFREDYKKEIQKILEQYK